MYLHIIPNVCIYGNSQRAVHNAKTMAKPLFKHGKTCRLLSLWFQKIPAQALAGQLPLFVVLPHEGPGFRSLQVDQLCMFT